MEKEKEIYIKRLLNSIEDELQIFINDNNVKDSSDIEVRIRYIQLLLKEISVSNAAALYYFSHMKNIPSKYIDNIITNIHALFLYILDKQQNKGMTLSLSEMAENFEIWQTDPVILHSIITKVYFLLYCLVSHFVVDKRWLMVTGDICYLLPRVVLSFMNIKSYQQNDELNNPSLGIIKNSYSLLVTIFQWTSDECLKIYATNRRQQYWCFRGLNILYNLSTLYMLQNNQKERKMVQDRMEAIRKRMYVEQQNRGNNVAEDLISMPLEKLLKLDSNYRKN